MLRQCLLAFALLIVGLPDEAADIQQVLLATTRNGWIEAIDPDTLQTLGRYSIGTSVEGVIAMPDGRTLLIVKSREFEDNGCCGLFTLDLATNALKPLLDIAQVAVITTDGSKIFTQRGNVGIDVFDGRTFARLPTIDAPGVYHLQLSPDDHWLYGTSNGPHPALDIFDLTESKRVRHLDVLYDFPRGVWLNGQFLLYAFDGKVGRLWTITPDTITLGAGVVVPIRNPAPGCKPVMQIPIAAAGRLFLYEIFGHKLDRRDRCNQSILGGVYEIDPVTGAVVSHLAPAVEFSRLVASHDGQSLYGIEIRPSRWTSPRLVKIDTESGVVLAERVLQDGVWNLSVAEIPRSLVPRQTIQIGSP